MQLWTAELKGVCFWLIEHFLQAWHCNGTGVRAVVHYLSHANMTNMALCQVPSVGGAYLFW